MASLKKERIERRELPRKERKEIQIVREFREISVNIANEMQGGSRLSEKKMANGEDADFEGAEALKQVGNNQK